MTLDQFKSVNVGNKSLPCRVSQASAPSSLWDTDNKLEVVKFDNMYKIIGPAKCPSHASFASSGGKSSLPNVRGQKNKGLLGNRQESAEGVGIRL